MFRNFLVGFVLFLMANVQSLHFEEMEPHKLQPRYYEVLQNYNAYLVQKRLACITYDFNVQSSSRIVYTFSGVSANTHDLRVVEGTIEKRKKGEADNSCWWMTATDTVPPTSQDGSWCVLTMDKEDGNWMLVTDSISQMTFALISDIHNFTLRNVVWDQVHTLFPTTNFRNITGNCPIYDPPRSIMGSSMKPT